MSSSRGDALDRNSTPDSPGPAEAVRLLDRYQQAVAERRYIPDLPPLTERDHTLALAITDELARSIDTYRHHIIDQALAAQVSWKTAARNLLADLNTVREDHRNRVDRHLSTQVGISWGALLPRPQDHDQQSGAGVSRAAGE